MKTYRLSRRLRLHPLPRAIPVTLGLFLVCAGSGVGLLGAIAAPEITGLLIASVEITCGIMLCDPGRRLAALFLTVLAPLSVPLIVYLHLDGREVVAMLWFLPLPVSLVPRLVAFAALGAVAAAILLDEETRLADLEDSRAPTSLRRLSSLFE